MRRAIIIPPRREDRALLGCGHRPKVGPSARPGAEAWLGTGLRWSPTLLLPQPSRTQPCFSFNAINPSVHHQIAIHPSRRGGTNVTI